MLISHGYKVSEVEDEQEHGWSFHARSGRTHFWLQLANTGEEFYLHTEDMGMWSKPKDYETFLQQIDAELRRDSRFSGLKWWPLNHWKEGVEPSDLPVDQR